MSSSSSSSSPKSVGAGSYRLSPRRESGYGVVTTAYGAVRDPHSTLGIVPGASKHEIKKAYRCLALQFHPDVCEGNHCTTNFQQINSAYETLLHATTPSVLEHAICTCAMCIHMFWRFQSRNMVTDVFHDFDIGLLQEDFKLGIIDILVTSNIATCSTNLNSEVIDDRTSSLQVCCSTW